MTKVENELPEKKSYDLKSDDLRGLGRKYYQSISKERTVNDLFKQFEQTNQDYAPFAKGLNELKKFQEKTGGHKGIMSRIYKKLGLKPYKPKGFDYKI
jgi:hypothetical protein